jgi:hypothetical protein
LRRSTRARLLITKGATILTPPQARV